MREFNSIDPYEHLLLPHPEVGADECEMLTRDSQRAAIPTRHVEALAAVLLAPEPFRKREDSELAWIPPGTRCIGTGFLISTTGIFASAAHVFSEDYVDLCLRQRLCLCFTRAGFYDLFPIHLLALNRATDAAVGRIAATQSRRPFVSAVKLSQKPFADIDENAYFLAMGFQDTIHDDAKIEFWPAFHIGSGASLDPRPFQLRTGPWLTDVSGPTLSLPVKARGGASGGPVAQLTRGADGKLRGDVVGIVSGTREESEEITRALVVPAERLLDVALPLESGGATTLREEARKRATSEPSAPAP